MDVVSILPNDSINDIYRYLDPVSSILFAVTCSRLSELFRSQASQRSQLLGPALPMPFDQATEALELFYFRSNDPRDDPYKIFSPAFLRFVAKEGHLGILRWVEESGRFVEPYPHFIGRVLLSLAAEFGHDDIIFHFIDRGCEIDFFGLNSIACNGRLAVLKKLMEKGVKVVDHLRPKLFTCVVNSGSMECLDWFLELRSLYPPMTFPDPHHVSFLRRGARRGGLAFFKRVLDCIGSLVPGDSNYTHSFAVLIAETFGLDEYLKFIEKYNLNRDLRDIALAAFSSGRRDLLDHLQADPKWLSNKNAEDHRLFFAEACRNGHVELLADLLKRCGAKGFGKAGNLELYFSGPFRNVVRAAEVVRFMVDNKILIKPEFVFQMGLPFDAVKIAFETWTNKKELKRCLHRAAAAGRVDVMQLLMETYGVTSDDPHLIIAEALNYHDHYREAIYYVNKMRPQVIVDDSLLGRFMDRGAHHSRVFAFFVGRGAKFTDETTKNLGMKELERMVRAGTPALSIADHLVRFQSWITINDPSVQSLLHSRDDLHHLSSENINK